MPTTFLPGEGSREIRRLWLTLAQKERERQARIERKRRRAEVVAARRVLDHFPRSVAERYLQRGDAHD